MPELNKCCEEMLNVVDYTHLSVEGTCGSCFDIEPLNFCPICGNEIDQNLREKVLSDIRKKQKQLNYI